MSAHRLAMPRLGETMEAGVIVRWLKSEGDAFKRGEALLEIETDKTIAEYPALGDGVLRRILAGAGAAVAVGRPIALLEGDAFAAAEPDLPATEPQHSAPLQAARPPAAGGAVRATPAARALAAKHRLALCAVAGTGRRGRVELRDVQSALAAGAEPEPQLQFADTGSGKITYLAQGPNNASKCFMLLHGFGGDMSVWGATAAALARAGAQAVTPDLPAHGRTEAEAGSFAQLVKTTGDFVDSFGGTLHLVGLSLGAAVAARLAGALAARPASLVLANPAGIGLPAAKDFVDGLAGAQSADDVLRLLDYLGPQAKAITGPQACAKLARQLSRGRLVKLAGELGAGRIDVVPELGALAGQLPVKVALGLSDKVMPPALPPSLPAACAVHLFAGAGHMLPWDAPGEFVELLLSAAAGATSDGEQSWRTT